MAGCAAHYVQQAVFTDCQRIFTAGRAQRNPSKPGFFAKFLDCRLCAVVAFGPLLGDHRKRHAPTAAQKPPDAEHENSR